MPEVTCILYFGIRLGERSVSRLGRFTLVERDSGTHCISEWMGPRIGPTVRILWRWWQSLSLPGIEQRSPCCFSERSCSYTKSPSRSRFLKCTPLTFGDSVFHMLHAYTLGDRTHGVS